MGICNNILVSINKTDNKLGGRLLTVVYVICASRVLMGSFVETFKLNSMLHEKKDIT